MPSEQNHVIIINVVIDKINRLLIPHSVTRQIKSMMIIIQQNNPTLNIVQIFNRRDKLNTRIWLKKYDNISYESRVGTTYRRKNKRGLTQYAEKLNVCLIVVVVEWGLKEFNQTIYRYLYVLYTMLCCIIIIVRV